MITDIVGDGDIRSGGGNPPPHVGGPTPPAPAVKRQPLLRMVHRAQTMGLTVAEALEGTGVSLKQFKSIAAWGNAKKTPPHVGGHKEGGPL